MRRTLARATVAALLLAFASGVGVAAVRTRASRLDTSQGAGSVWEEISALGRRMLSHQHDGSDGSSRLSSPFSEGKILLKSPDGSCWECGPDNSGTWACAASSACE